MATASERVDVRLTTNERLAALELMQTSRAGSPELDARIDCLLQDRVFAGMASGSSYRWRAGEADGPCEAKAPASCWSEDLTASLWLVPSGSNFSIGMRDGVCWAWIQPNDDWAPAIHEHRHDHPTGSGLVVAYTMALALTSAAIIMRHAGVRPV